MLIAFVLTDLLVQFHLGLYCVVCTFWLLNLPNNPSGLFCICVVCTDNYHECLRLSEQLILLKICYYYLTAIWLTPGGSSTHLHTNSTQITVDGTYIIITRGKKWEVNWEVRDMPRLLCKLYVNFQL
jgi:uncharacterized membrane protein YczE